MDLQFSLPQVCALDVLAWTIIERFQVPTLNYSVILNWPVGEGLRSPKSIWPKSDWNSSREDCQVPSATKSNWHSTCELSVSFYFFGFVILLSCPEALASSPASLSGRSSQVLVMFFFHQVTCTKWDYGTHGTSKAGTVDCYTKRLARVCASSLCLHGLVITLLWAVAILCFVSVLLYRFHLVTWLSIFE